MAMIGAQRSGGGNVPAQVVVEIAKDPGKFDRRIAEYEAARDAANAAQAAAHEAQRELAATQEALARTEADLAWREQRLAAAEPELKAGLERLAGDREALARDLDGHRARPLRWRPGERSAQSRRPTAPAWLLMANTANSGLALAAQFAEIGCRSRRDSSSETAPPLDAAKPMGAIERKRTCYRETSIGSS